jgi:protein-L-isoaspartate(D-aspartate) O-methyltransferase
MSAMDERRGGSGSVGAFAEERRTMVTEQLMARGIADPRLLAVMGMIERHRFVEPALASAAYEDRPLPIGYGQTISQPYMVARATELAAPEPGDRALEVGAGSGYQAAVLAALCAEVFAVEIVPQLADRARRALAESNLRNVTIEAFDGSGGWPAHAPYDVIVVSAGAPRIPALLVGELADGGRLVIPVGGPHEQELALVKRVGDDYQTTFETRCRYVDLRGRFGVGGGAPAA